MHVHAPPAGGPPNLDVLPAPGPMPRSRLHVTAAILALVMAALRALQAALQFVMGDGNPSWAVVIIAGAGAAFFAWGAFGIFAGKTKAYDMVSLGQWIFTGLAALGLLLIFVKYGNVFSVLLEVSPPTWAAVFVLPIAVFTLHLAGAIVTGRARAERMREILDEA